MAKHINMMDKLPVSTHISNKELVRPNEGMLNLLTTQLKFAQDTAHFLSKQSVELTGKTLLELHAWIEQLEKQVRDESNKLLEAAGMYSDIDDPESDYICSIMPPPLLSYWDNPPKPHEMVYVVDMEPEADGFFIRHVYSAEGRHLSTTKCQLLLGEAVEVPVD